MAQNIQQTLDSLTEAVDTYVSELTYAPISEITVLCDMLVAYDPDINPGYHKEDFEATASEDNLIQDDILIQIAIMDNLVARWSQVRRDLVEKFAGE